MTSGEAAMQAINQNKFGKKFFHLGPPRDSSIFEKVKENKTKLIIVILFFALVYLMKHEESIHEIYYQKFLNKHISKKLVCTNPDLTVHRGNKEEYCAGYIAKIFEELGGKLFITENLTKKYIKCVLNQMKKF